ncbi:MAG: methyltransferase domain-containing protein, partial [Hyphomicrobiales bacterium]|nr:methyltransferase domain-containing protein [Hyphomicrobiales bacterium]
AALEPKAGLCCPSAPEPALLDLLPREIIDRDYGCGDLTRFIRPGDIVLDLGSGSGKGCYIAAQLTGPEGFVIGVDANDEMLALARRYQGEMARKLGSDRVRFVKGLIQDLALDLEQLDLHLAECPVQSAIDLVALEDWKRQVRRKAPMIADASVDLVVSNCVMNLVAEADRPAFICEIARVLRPGGRVAIADIVSDKPVPDALKADTELWSDCVSGAYLEGDLIRAFAEAGFHAIRIESRTEKPWQIVDGISFRSVTISAVRNDDGACIYSDNAVIYRGPYAEVRDEDGHVFPRGEPVPVCEKTFTALMAGPYGDDFFAASASGEVGGNVDVERSSACGPGTSCC